MKQLIPCPDCRCKLDTYIRGGELELYKGYTYIQNEKKTCIVNGFVEFYSKAHS